MKQRSARHSAAENPKSSTFMRSTFTVSKFLVFTGVIAVLAGVAFWFYQYNQSPATGVVQPPSPPESQVKSISLARFSGQTFSLEHPSHYSSVENRAAAASKSILEQYLMSMRGNGTESRQISILIKPGTTATMMEDSAYKFRLLSAGYQTSSETIHEKQMPKTVKKDDSEVAYFISGKNAYAIIVATSTNPGDEFRKDAAQVIESFKWNE